MSADSTATLAAYPCAACRPQVSASPRQLDASPSGAPAEVARLTRSGPWPEACDRSGQRGAGKLQAQVVGLIRSGPLPRPVTNPAKRRGIESGRW
eukprot:356655-Chlamydomonas_euryale.AAC.1